MIVGRRPAMFAQGWTKKRNPAILRDHCGIYCLEAVHFFIMLVMLVVIICVFSRKIYAEKADSVKLVPDDEVSYNEERCRDVLQKIFDGNTEDLSISVLSGDECFDLARESITLYEDGDFLFAVIDPSGGMQKIEGTRAYSLDGGRVWHVGNFYARSGLGDMYILDRKILMVDGIHGVSATGTYTFPRISLDYGKTYALSLTCSNVEKITALPFIQQDYSTYCYPRVNRIDRKLNRMEISYYLKSFPSYGEAETEFYRQVIRLSDFAVLEEKDLYGLGSIAEEYDRSGCIFTDSSSERLAEKEIRTRFLNECCIAGQKGTANEIRLAINEIYAKKGYDFSGTDYESYFSSKSWYEPVPGKVISEGDLTSVEKANIDLLVEIEKTYQNMIEE